MDNLTIFVAKYLLVFVVLGIVVIWLMLPKEQRGQAAVTIVTTGILALILSRIAGSLYYDPRPFVNHNVIPLIPHAADNGFPSDHALFTMALTAIAFFYNKKIAWIMLALTALVGIARVMAHVHSPIDIIGAWVIAVVAAVASYYLVDKFWPTTKAQKS